MNNGDLNQDTNDNSSDTHRAVPSRSRPLEPLSQDLRSDTDPRPNLDVNEVYYTATKGLFVDSRATLTSSTHSTESKKSASRLIYRFLFGLFVMFYILTLVGMSIFYVFIDNKVFENLYARVFLYANIAVFILLCIASIAARKRNSQRTTSSFLVLLITALSLFSISSNLWRHFDHSTAKQNNETCIPSIFSFVEKVSSVQACKQDSK